MLEPPLFPLQDMLPTWRRGCLATDRQLSLTLTAAMKVRMSLQHASGAAPVDIDIVVHPEWAPLGAERFEALVKANYFNECPLYRNIPGFIIQWGIPADPSAWKQYGEKKIKDDPVKISNKLGTLSFATSGPSKHSASLQTNPHLRLASPPRLTASRAACHARRRARQPDLRQLGQQRQSRRAGLLALRRAGRPGGWSGRARRLRRSRGRRPGGRQESRRGILQPVPEPQRLEGGCHSRLMKLPGDGRTTLACAGLSNCKTER